MTNDELYKMVNSGERITKECTNIFLELDRTSSVATQAELNELLTGIYSRIENEKVVVEVIDEENPVSKEQFAAWVNDNFDVYSAKMFGESK